MQLGQRIMIIGSGGAGKSTLARQLGAVTGLPVIHLDAEHWRPGWVETPKEEWRRKVEELTRRDRWIMDGNYGGTLAIRMAAAETVIFLDYPWWLCLGRVLKRQILYRGQTRPDLTPGCPERLDREFLRWICFDFPRRNRPRLLGLVEEYQEGRHIIIHRSPKETRRWLAEIEGSKA
ncbi:MAG: topology modulation protein [bacterium ADurb.Bin429]|nr:MAG: topology modulation protein [bacterium ADurb.Bin429]